MNSEECFENSETASPYCCVTFEGYHVSRRISPAQSMMFRNGSLNLPGIWGTGQKPSLQMARRKLEPCKERDATKWSWRWQPCLDLPIANLWIGLLRECPLRAIH